MAAQLPLKFTAGQISQFVASTDSIPVTVGGTGVVALSDILGTTNQISVASGAARVIGGNVTLSTPQNIDTAATVTFGTVTTSSATTTQLTAGSTGSNRACININNAAGGQQSVMNFTDAGTVKWQLGKQTDNTFFLFDSVNGSTTVLVNTSGKGSFGIGTTPTGKLHVAAVTGDTSFVLNVSGTTTGATLVQMNPTTTSTSTGQITGLNMAPSFNPGGASLSTIVALTFIPSIIGSSLTIGNVYSMSLRLDSTAGFSGTVTTGRLLVLNDSSNFVGGAITTLTGIYIDNLAKGTNNRGIDSNVASGSNKYNLYVAGTAANYFAGHMLIGTTTDNAYLYLVQSVSTSGSPTAFRLDGAAHTTLAASTEAIDANFNLARTVQFATATPATQRAVLIQAPTYSCDTAAQTITSAGTLVVSGAPVAGTNVTITNSYSMWSQGGRIFFDSGVSGFTNAWKFMKVGSQNVSLTSTGNNSTIGILIAESHAPTTGTYGIYVENHITSAAFVSGGHFQASGDATSGTISNVEGGAMVGVAHIGGETISLMEGIYAECLCDHATGTITLTSSQTVWARVTLNQAGTLTATNVYGVLVDPTIGANTTITTMYGIKVGAVSNGTITTGYGLYIDTVRGTTNYAIYQASTSNNNFFAGKFSTYNNITTVKNGVASEVASVDSTGLTANVGATTAYAVPASGAGLYRISVSVELTTAASVSSTLPNLQIKFTSADSSTVITIDATPVLGAAGIGQTGALTGNTVGLTSVGVIVVNAKASTNIQYQTVNYASSLAGMAYAIHIIIEAL
jgi:hypothetical protein